MSFCHHVLFYPRAEAQADDADQLETLCRTLLAGIPGVERIRVGRPAGTDRPVVDNDYLLALFLEFPDAAAEAAYQVHPDHVAFVEQSRPLWSHVRVCDTIVQ